MDAQAEIKKWLSQELLSDREKEEIRALSEEEIRECFGRNLEFGTGGLRGIMRPGTNSMNIYTVRKATQGLADEILAESERNAEKGVVIAYDSRNHSAEFAWETACVLCGNHIKTFLFESLRPTPELSFAVRHLQCCRGIVITASHNPKEYNGYKVYGEDGGQILPEHAQRILEYIRSVDVFRDIKRADSPEPVMLGKETDDAYIAAVKKESFGTEIPEDLRVIYTPLHGSGTVPVQRILSETGVKNVLVPESQLLPDGNFPTVKSPNPEESSAFTQAIRLAEQTGNIDLILGTDPDSDRMGIAVKDPSGQFITLSGNQTAAILCDFILRNTVRKGMPVRPKIVKTVVTTEMVTAIAKRYGVETVNVLTGFKYIGDQIRRFEKTGESFLFGCEESYGCLKGTYARDKDAVVAAMLICEAAAECKAAGITLYDRLQELYREYGFYREKLLSFTFAGLEGMEKIAGILVRLSETDPTDGEIRRNDIRDENGQLRQLQFIFRNGTLTARPSGTEPKIKFYCAVKAGSLQEAEELLAQQETFVRQFCK